MKRRTLIQSAGASALSAWLLAVNAAEASLPKVGAALALPDVPLLDGGTFRAADAKGQVVVVYWWASWCPFCAVQTPYVQKLWEAQRSRGLRMLGLSVDQRIEDARKYMRQSGYTFPTGFNTHEVEAVLPKPGKALPVTLVRGRDGRVVMAEMGQLFPEDLEQIARFL